MTDRKFSQRILLFSWLALLLSVCVTADIVIDLFEDEANLTMSAQSFPVPEEIENVLENLLFPSVQEGSSALRLHQSLAAMDLDSRGLSLLPPPETDGNRHRSAREWIPPHSPPSSVIPLRI